MDTVQTFDQVLIGNEVILYDYPASLGLPDSHQFDPLRPLLRRGLIAAADPQRHSLVIDGPAIEAIAEDHCSRSTRIFL
jgi:hypothetical protein